MSVDGVDKKDRERSKRDDDPKKELNQDRTNMSKKHHHGALKYQITLAAQRQQIVHIYGPVKGSISDKVMLQQSGILDRLKKGKLIHVDRGYIDRTKKDKLSWPNLHDDKKTHRMKSRIRLRHESLNGKFATFGTMDYEWKKHTVEQHGISFRAVAVTIQYGLNDGSRTLFDA